MLDPDPREFDLIVPMGAVWAVYDADKIHWIRQELDLLRNVLDPRSSRDREVPA